MDFFYLLIFALDGNDAVRFVRNSFNESSGLLFGVDVWEDFMSSGKSGTET